MKALKMQHFIRIRLKTPTLSVACSNRVGRTIKISTPTGVGIFIARYGSKFMPRRGKSCRAYHKNIHPNRGGYFYHPTR